MTQISPRGPLHRMELAAVRWLFALPPWIKLLLSLRPQIELDGESLEPEVQLMLVARKLRGGSTLRDADIRTARARLRRESVHYAGDGAPIRSVRELSI